MSDTSNTGAEAIETRSAAAWKRAKAHPVTLPSGFEIKLSIPNLATMAQSGQLPNDLVKYAIPEVAGQPDVPTTPEEAEKTIKKLADFQAWIVAVSVVEPQVTEDDVRNEELPTEDVEKIVALATRQTDMDAVGHQLGGLEKVDSFRRIRGLGPLDEDLLG